MSPSRRRLGLYYRFLPNRAVKAPDVIQFLRHLHRHLRRGFVVLWDRSRSHRARVVQEFLDQHPSILTEFLPAYAPELNPDEHFWGLLKNHRLANHGFAKLRVLHRRLHYHSARIRKRQDLLRGCLRASELLL